MSLKKILAQKLKHPTTKEWIETSYVAVDSDVDNTPVIYTHGTLADNDVIEGRHIQEGVIANYHLAADAVGQDEIAANAVTRPKILNGAINTDKLANSAVTSSKIALTATLLGTFNNVPRYKITIAP